ncbi:O-antigen ligase family protein [Paenibacillus sp. D51F]
MNPHSSVPKYIKKEEADFSLIKWAAIIMAGIFFFLYSFRTGLFNGYGFSFEKKLVGASLFSLVFILVMSLHLFKVWKDKSWKSILSIVVWLLPLSFGLSSINATSDNYSHIMTMISFLLAGFFVFGLYFNDTKYSRAALEFILMGSSYILVWFGIINLFGHHWYPDALWFQLGNYRMTSVFQYPNTYAALLIAVMLASTYYATHARAWWWRAIHAFMLVPAFISFMLTYSRAALVIIPLAVLVTLPFMRLARQISFLLHLAVTVIVSFGILSVIETKSAAILQRVLRFNEAGSQVPPEKLLSFWSSEALAVWGILISASLAATALSLIVSRWIEPWLQDKLRTFSKRRISFVVTPIAMIVLAAAAAAIVLTSSAVRGLLPPNLADRLENISFKQHSVLERGTFYENGFKIAADYPILGGGGGAWNALYQKYQSNPYTSNQAHSYLVQTLVETGYLGLLIHFGFFVLIFVLFIRLWIRHPDRRGSQLVYFIFAISLLLHSLFDFDMSYITFASMFFFALGGMIGSYGKETALTSFRFKKPALTRIYPAALIVLALGVGIITCRSYASYLQFDKALTMGKEQRSIEEIFPPLDRAIELSPSNTQYLLVKADWLTQVFNQTKNVDYLTQAEKSLQKAQLHEPYSRQILQARYQNESIKGKDDQVLALIDEGLKNFPWDITLYEMGIQQYTDIGLSEKEAGNSGFEAKWNRAQEIYQGILSGMDKLKNLPAEQLQGKRFDIAPMTRQKIGLILYQSRRYQEAADILQPISGDSLEADPAQDAQVESKRVATARQAVRYYLASLSKQGQNDDSLKEKLIQSDSNEANLLNELMAVQ